MSPRSVYLVRLIAPRMAIEEDGIRNADSLRDNPLFAGRLDPIVPPCKSSRAPDETAAARSFVNRRPPFLAGLGQFWQVSRYIEPLVALVRHAIDVGASCESLLDKIRSSSTSYVPFFTLLSTLDLASRRRDYIMLLIIAARMFGNSYSTLALGLLLWESNIRTSRV